jgi:hypothetical protein
MTRDKAPLMLESALLEAAQEVWMENELVGKSVPDRFPFTFAGRDYVVHADHFGAQLETPDGVVLARK